MPKKLFIMVYPGARRDNLMKVQDDVQNILGDEYAVRCYDIEPKHIPTDQTTSEYQSAMLCLKFDERVLGYKKTVNELVRSASPVRNHVNDIHVVCNVFEDLLMLYKDELILQKHMDCFFGAIFRAIKNNPFWMKEIKLMNTKDKRTYNYLMGFYE